MSSIPPHAHMTVAGSTRPAGPQHDDQARKRRAIPEPPSFWAVARWRDAGWAGLGYALDGRYGKDLVWSPTEHNQGEDPGGLSRAMSLNTPLLHVNDAKRVQRQWRACSLFDSGGGGIYAMVWPLPWLIYMERRGWVRCGHSGNWHHILNRR